MLLKKTNRHKVNSYICTFSSLKLKGPHASLNQFLHNKCTTNCLQLWDPNRFRKWITSRTVKSTTISSPTKLLQLIPHFPQWEHCISGNKSNYQSRNHLLQRRRHPLQWSELTDASTHRNVYTQICLHTGTFSHNFTTFFFDRHRFRPKWLPRTLESLILYVFPIKCHFVRKNPADSGKSTCCHISLRVEI